MSNPEFYVRRFDTLSLRPYTRHLLRCLRVFTPTDFRHHPFARVDTSYNFRYAILSYRNYRATAVSSNYHISLTSVRGSLAE